jgi:hypothetical protein
MLEQRVAYHQKQMAIAVQPVMANGARSCFVRLGGQCGCDDPQTEHNRKTVAKTHSLGRPFWLESGRAAVITPCRTT